MKGAFYMPYIYTVYGVSPVPTHHIKQVRGNSFPSRIEPGPVQCDAVRTATTISDGRNSTGSDR